MNKIQIVSWLLTRKCNLNCSYCALVSDYIDKPEEYPDMKHYIQNEMSTSYVIELLRRLKLHNPDCFHILYGGEPMLRKDLPDIVNYCNKEKINYTIITNNTDEVQPMIDRLFAKVEYVTGFTTSIDPMVMGNKDDSKEDRVRKCLSGFERIVSYGEKVKDPVAEITVDKQNLQHLYELVKELSNSGVNSDITFIDIAKTPYYDFSNVNDKSLLVTPEVAAPEIEKIINDESLDIHMKETLLPEILKILPAELDCGIENDIHNLTIDADGSPRLCLRIRGVRTPQLPLMLMLHEDGSISHDILRLILGLDKKKYCEGCNWTCQIMSRLLSEEKGISDDLIHKDRRY